MRLLHRFHCATDGLAALETALVFPTVLIVLLLIMDTGVFFYDYVSASASVHEAARCGAVGHDDAAVTARVENGGGFDDPGTVDVDRTAGRVGDEITVTAAYDHDWILPASIFGVPSAYSVSSTMRIESVAVPPQPCAGGGGP